MSCMHAIYSTGIDNSSQTCIQVTDGVPQAAAARQSWCSCHYRASIPWLLVMPSASKARAGDDGFQPPVAGGSRRIEHCATLPLVQACTSLTVNVPSSSIFEGINPGHRCTEIRSDPIPSCAEAVAVDCYKTRAITGTPARHGSETLLERLYQSNYQMRYWSAQCCALKLV
ncbi:hypothetical protein IQ07DRAFT_603236 [Pyrenochaeta sp. DS3sAY3a]|nr:hypothetical protein IQ07DRAFT_603236 [Pyrenochaeta sp. DS3sAY3a]